MTLEISTRLAVNPNSLAVSLQSTPTGPEPSNLGGSFTPTAQADNSVGFATRNDPKCSTSMLVITIPRAPKAVVSVCTRLVKARSSCVSVLMAASTRSRSRSRRARDSSSCTIPNRLEIKLKAKVIQPTKMNEIAKSVRLVKLIVSNAPSCCAFK